MAKNFGVLQAKMQPEVHARAQAKAEALMPEEVSISIKLPKDVAKELRVEAARQDMTRHKLMKEIIFGWLERRPKEN